MNKTLNAILLKTMLVGVSSNQIMQIRGKTVAKVFRKVDTIATYQKSAHIKRQNESCNIYWIVLMDMVQLTVFIFLHSQP